MVSRPPTATGPDRTRPDAREPVDHEPGTSAAEPAATASWGDARRLLRGPLRTLIGGQSLGQAADGMAQVTLAQVVLFEADRGATPLALATLLAVTLLPFSVVGPVAGVLIDRWDRRRVMMLVSVLRAGLVLIGLVALSLDSVVLAYACVLLLLSSSRFVLAAKGAALPRTVGRDDLVAANALSSLIGMSSAFGAAVIGATFVGVTPAAGFLVACGGYLAAAAAFGRLSPVGGGEGTVELAAGLARLRAELADELRTVALQEEVRRPLLAVWGHRLLLGAGFVLLVLIADHHYELEAPGYGLALAVTGVGAFAGTVAAPILGRRFEPTGLLSLAFLVAGAAAAVGAFWPNLAVLVAGLGVAALGFQVLKVCVDALVQRAARDQVRGRVFAAYDVLYNVAFVLAGLALVPLWAVGRERMLLWGLAVAFGAVGALVARSQRSWPFHRPRAAPAGRSRRVRAAAVVAGAVPALAFPAPSWSWLGFVGFVPILVLVARAHTGREGAILAWCGGTGFMLAAHHWLTPNAGPFVIPLAGLLALTWVLWGRLAWWAVRAPRRSVRIFCLLAVVPSAWVLGEFVRSWEGLGGPWSLLGASQWQSHRVLGLAAAGGPWLIGFVLMAANAVAAAAVLERRWPERWRWAAALVVVIAVANLGGALHRPPVTGELRVGGVQPGVIHDPVERFDEGERLTRHLIGSGADLVVWGESSVGMDPDEEPEYLERVQALAAQLGSDVLVNVDAQRGLEEGIFKTALLVGPGGPEASFDKIRLVPFGEYIPARPAFSWVEWIPRAPVEDRRRGDELVLMDTAGVQIGPLICFESAFPDMSRRLASMGAEVIVFQSATSTFQESWAPAQHASLASLRAVETGRPVVHATLTGVSAAFDARGRKLAWMGTDETGTYLVDLPLSDGTTLFVRLGDWVPALSVLTLVGAGVGSGLVAARRPVTAPGP